MTDNIKITQFHHEIGLSYFCLLRLKRQTFLSTFRIFYY